MIYIEEPSRAYINLFQKMGVAITHDLNKATAACFTGGEDVSPLLYGEAPHHTTHSNIQRDEREMKIFDELLQRKIPMVGICRGSQFLNVMSGGKMYQNVSSHCRDHELKDTRTGERVFVSSTHHQMMWPSVEGIVVAQATHFSNREWVSGGAYLADRQDEGCEAVYYPETRCLCFQPHPEFTSDGYQGMFAYFVKLLNEFAIIKTGN